MQEAAAYIFALRGTCSHLIDSSISGPLSFKSIELLHLPISRVPGRSIVAEPSEGHKRHAFHRSYLCLNASDRLRLVDRITNSTSFCNQYVLVTHQILFQISDNRGELRRTSIRQSVPSNK